MLKTDAEQEPSRLGRGRVLGAIGAAAALVVSSLIPSIAHADPAPAGEYVGTTEQTHASDEPVENWEGYDYSPTTWTQPFSFSIDENSTIVDVAGEFWWACENPLNYGYTNFADSTPAITGTVEVDQQFEMAIETASHVYTFEGIVNRDGTAEGRLLADLGFCGASLMNWSAANDDVEVVPPPAGTYEGGSTAIGNPDVSFEVDSAGVMSNFETTSYCRFGLGDQEIVWAGMPPTTVGANNSFDIEWTHEIDGEVVHFELSGVVTPSGWAQGTGAASIPGECGSQSFNWNADLVEDSEPIEVTAEAPTFENNTVTIPTIEGITYTDNNGTTLTGDITLTEGQTLTVTATANDGYVLTDGATEWTYTYEDTGNGDDGNGDNGNGDGDDNGNGDGNGNGDDNGRDDDSDDQDGSDDHGGDNGKDDSEGDRHGDLPRTGAAGAAAAAGLGALLIAAGAGCLLIARRRGLTM